jgi:hypothetical protein
VKDPSSQKIAPSRLVVSDRLAPYRSVRLRSAKERSACERSAPCKLAPCKSTPLSGCFWEGKSLIFGNFCKCPHNKVRLKYNIHDEIIRHQLFILRAISYRGSQLSVTSSTKAETLSEYLTANCMLDRALAEVPICKLLTFRDFVNIRTSDAACN